MERGKSILVVVCAIIGLSIVSLFILSRFEMSISRYTWAGAPSGTQLENLIETRWLKNPPDHEAANRRDPSSLGFSTETRCGPAKAAKLTSQWVRQARYGELKDGTRVTYWPVLVSIDTTYEQRGPGVVAGHSIIPTPDSLTSVVQRWSRSQQQPESVVVNVRSRTSTCYAFKDNDGWEVSFDMLTDRTPLLKIW